MPRPRGTRRPGRRFAERLRALHRQWCAQRLPPEDRRLFLVLFAGLGACALLVFAVASLPVATASATRRQGRSWSRAAILDAIRWVESSHRDDVPDGDGGRAIGPYQIHVEYWQDALRAEPALGGTWQDCRRRDYAERIVAAYMRKYEPEAWTRGDAEVIARTHNGGPRGFDNPATEAYWRRVLLALDARR
jgi:hypothetical protein